MSPAAAEIGPPSPASVEALAGAERLLVACDFDGVLSPIVADPAAARPLAGSIEALGRLVELPATTVAVVSGREHRQLEQLVTDPHRFLLVGSHGAELQGELAADSLPVADEVLVEAIERLTTLAAAVPGLHIEAKSLSVAAHLRRVPADHRARAEAGVDEVKATWPGRVIEGKEVVELSLATDTKGDALMVLMARVDATATVYVGDDVTDEDAFVAVAAAANQIGVGVKVGSGETAATHRVADPAAVEVLLAALADQRAAACQRD